MLLPWPSARRCLVVMDQRTALGREVDCVGQIESAVSQRLPESVGGGLKVIGLDVVNGEVAPRWQRFAGQELLGTQTKALSLDDTWDPLDDLRDVNFVVPAVEFVFGCGRGRIDEYHHFGASGHVDHSTWLIRSIGHFSSAISDGSMLFRASLNFVGQIDNKPDETVSLDTTTSKGPGSTVVGKGFVFTESLRIATAMHPT